MKKSVKIGNQRFLHLDDHSLLYDSPEGSQPLPISFDIAEKVLDFSYSDEGTIYIFTSDGHSIESKMDSLSSPTIFSYGRPFISASICQESVLAISENDYGVHFLNFKGEIIETYSEIKKQVRYCLLTPQIKVVADSSAVFLKRQGQNRWEKIKFREFFITHLFNINRNNEFGITTSKNTRVFQKHYQTVFRQWAKKTVSMLQCPCRRHFYAHLDSDGLLRIGDNDTDYSLQESDVTGICWDMGLLWVRSRDGKWKSIAMAFEDQMFDLRSSKLSGLQAPLHLNERGKVLDVLENIIARPSMSKEIMTILPPIAQNLTSGIIVNEAKHSLDAYIGMSESVHGLLGQLDLALSK